MRKIKIVSIFIIALLLSGYGCNKSDNNQIELTISNFLSSIKNNNHTQFRNIIANKSVTMSEDHDFDLLHRLYKKSLYSKQNKKLNYTVLDSSNVMGQKVIKLPYFKGYDSITAITQIDMIFYFGPTQMFSLDKLSGFETKYDWNSEQRRKLLGLPPLSNKADSIKKTTGKSVIEKPEGW